MLKDLYNTDKNKNNELVIVIKSKLSYLKDEIEKMSEHDVEIERPQKIEDIAEKILEFNRQNQEL